MYKNDNTSHYDYFDYLDGSGKKQQFEPNSDMDFLEFKKTIKREWLEAHSPVEGKKWCFWLK